MEIDWERRRKNSIIFMALMGTNATALAKANNLSPNTLTKFTSGKTEKLSNKSMQALLKGLNLSTPEDLDTDDPIHNPEAELRRIIRSIPKKDLPDLLRELQIRFPNEKPGS